MRALPVFNYTTGIPILLTPKEMGWKDSIIALPGHVTVIRIRFAPQAAPTTAQALLH